MRGREKREDTNCFEQSARVVRTYLKDYLQPNKKSKISQKGGAIGYSDLSLAVPYCLFKKGILSVGSEGDWVIAEQRGRTKNFA